MIKPTDYNVIIEISGGVVDAVWTSMDNPKILLIDHDEIRDSNTKLSTATLNQDGMVSSKRCKECLHFLNN